MSIKGMFDTSLSKLLEAGACDGGIIRFGKNVRNSVGEITLAEIIKQQNNCLSDISWHISRVVDFVLSTEQLHELAKMLTDWFEEDPDRCCMLYPTSLYSIVSMQDELTELTKRELAEHVFCVMDDMIEWFAYNESMFNETEHATELMKFMEQL